MPSDNQNALELLRRGYDEDTRVLNFRVTVDRELWDEALDAIGDYNDFDPAKLKDALARFPRFARVEFAREGSPAIYVGGVYDEAERTTVLNALRGADADELAREKDGRTIRAWWD